jgi:hypothetical protein
MFIPNSPEEVLNEVNSEFRESFIKNSFADLFWLAQEALDKESYIENIDEIFITSSYVPRNKKIAVLKSAIIQLMNGIGQVRDVPFYDLDVAGFYALSRAIGLYKKHKQTKHFHEVDGERGALDVMTMVIASNDKEVTLYNFCTYPEVD